jgi:hypothetical protein
MEYPVVNQQLNGWENTSKRCFSEMKMCDNVWHWHGGQKVVKMTETETEKMDKDSQELSAKLGTGVENNK